MYCPSCGKGIADSSAFCRYCGKSTGVEAQAEVASTTAQLANSLACPNCHQIDAVRHRNTIMGEGVRAEETTTHSASYGLGQATSVEFDRKFRYQGISLGSSSHALSGFAQSESRSATALAAMLSAVADGINEYNRQFMPPEPADPSSIKTRDIFPRGEGYRLQAVHSYASYYAEWGFRNWLVSLAFQKKWENIYYCGRCAGVFVPGEDEFVPLNRLENYLYQYPSVVEQDYCMLFGFYWIKGWQGFLQRVPPQPRWLLALGYGENGVYVVKERHWTDTWSDEDPEKLGTRLQSHVHNDLASQCPACKDNYEQMATELQSAGWVRLPEHGPKWYSARFMLPHDLSSGDH